MDKGKSAILSGKFIRIAVPVGVAFGIAACDMNRPTDAERDAQRTRGAEQGQPAQKGQEPGTMASPRVEGQARDQQPGSAASPRPAEKPGSTGSSP